MELRFNMLVFKVIGEVNLLLIRTLIVSFFALSISGCSWLYGEKGLIRDREYDYLNSKMEKTLETPPGLHPLVDENDLKVPDLAANQKQPVLGKDLDDRPPILILASGEKMGIDSEDNQTLPQVWFRYDEIEFWQGIQDYFAKKKINVANKDLENGIIETDWITHTRDSYWRYIFGADDNYSERTRYRFQITPNNQGTEKVLRVSQLEKQVKKTRRKPWSESEVSNQNAILFMNGFLGYWSENEDKQATERVKLANLGIKLEIAKDDNGAVVFVADASFQETWSKLAVVLPELGFALDDKDQSLGVYMGEYKVKAGALNFFSTLFGQSHKDILEIKETDYQINLSQKQQKTQITLSEKEGAKLSNETMERILPLFAKAFEKDLNR